MKNLSRLFLFLSVIAAGCTQDGDNFAPASGGGGVEVAQRVADASQDLIRQSLAIQSERGQLSSVVSEREARILAEVLKADVPYEMSCLTHVSDTLMYVVNYTDGSGWQLLSSDKRTQPVLAYGKSGSFSLDDLNPGEMIWLDETAEALSVMRADEAVFDSEAEFIAAVDSTWVDLAPATMRYDTRDEGEWRRESVRNREVSETVGPLTRTKWGQREPWNQYCPKIAASAAADERSLAGCVAVAGAQMLYYLHYLWGIPAAMFESASCSGYLSNYRIEFGNPTAEAWDKMLKISYFPGDYKAAHNSSVLIAFVGAKVGMKYGKSSSSAKTEDLKEVFGELGINSVYRDYRVKTVFELLDEKVPVVMRANGSRTNRFLGLIYTYEDGHSWLIDGYEKKYQETSTTYRWYNYYTTPGDIGDGFEVGPGKNIDDKEPSIEDVRPGQDTVFVATRGMTRPIYRTDKTKVVTSRTPKGEFWHMNWGWDGDEDRWYGVNEVWRANGKTYQWRREMLVIKGYN